jgi:protein-S-isoprenylcysteine O-methyltransferase Ste14
MKENRKKEKANYVYITIIVLILSICLCLRLFFGSFLFPIPNIVAWLVGGVLFLVGFVISNRWHKFSHKIYSGKLVTEGIYEYIRHPHYSSIIVAVFGASFLLQSLPVFLFAVLNVAILNQAAKEEEEYLIKTHGDAYKKYKEKVRWRFIPWII